MKIIGIDQSFTCSGLVVFEDEKIIEFNAIKSNKEDDKFNRAVFIIDEIFKLYDKHKPDIMRVEGLAFGTSGNATRDLAGLLFSIITHGIKNYTNFNYEIVSPKQVKRFATGSGKATKTQMIEALPEDVRMLFENENYKKTTGLADLADAYFIGQMVS